MSAVDFGTVRTSLNRALMHDPHPSHGRKAMAALARIEQRQRELEAERDSLLSRCVDYIGERSDLLDSVRELEKKRDEIERPAVFATLAEYRARVRELEEALEEVMPESHHPTCAVYLPQEECDCGYDLAEAALARIPESKESPATRKSA